VSAIHQFKLAVVQSVSINIDRRVRSGSHAPFGMRKRAWFKDGVLTVHVPKNPTAKSKAIEIKVQ
jgi:HSP20 family molecular chaperone IbpA